MFGLPNEETRQNDFAIEVPKLVSIILTHEWNGELKGLNEFPGNHPPVAPVFWAFRIMVGTGVLMLIVSWATAFCLWRKKDIITPLAYVLVPMAFSGWGAAVSGWYVTEIGRQPWLVTGVLKTVDAISDVPTPMIGLSLSMYLMMYMVVMTAFIATLFYMARKAGQKTKPPLSFAAGQTVLNKLN